jgi:hypothetical protein
LLSTSVSLGRGRIAHTFIHMIGMPLPLQETWSRSRHLSNLCDWNWRPQLQTSATPWGRYVRPSGLMMRMTRDRWERSDDDGARPLAANLTCGGDFVAATVFVAGGFKYRYEICIRPSSIDPNSIIFGLFICIFGLNLLLLLGQKNRPIKMLCRFPASVAP